MVWYSPVEIILNLWRRKQSRIMNLFKQFQYIPNLNLLSERPTAATLVDSEK